MHIITRREGMTGFAIFVAMFAEVVISAPTTQPAPEDASMSAVAFMAGHWAHQGPNTRAEEYWTPAAAGTMFGSARTIRGEKTVFFEYLRIEKRDDGIYYVASPRGQGATPFKLIESGANRAVFENPAHDFPTRISYWIEDGALCARIEGKRRDQPASESWRFLPIVPAGSPASGSR